jgi:hypothetical protein
MKKAGFWLMAGLLLLAPVLLSPATGADDKSVDGWIQLFDGKSLDGWKASTDAEGKGADAKTYNNWKVEDGAIVANGPRSHLFYVGNDPSNPAEFENFHFKAEIMTAPGSNSGIFFHSKYQADGWPKIGYEAQVNNTHGDPVKSASIYNIKKNFEIPAKDNEWFTEEIIVEGKHIITKIDGKTIIDYTEPDDIDRNKWPIKGLFALQAHDPKSVVKYRSVAVKPLPARK